MFSVLNLYDTGEKRIFYGWIVLILCFLGLVASLGIRLSFGAFVTSWESEFDISRGAITLISALSLVVYGASQPVAGRLSDVFGARVIMAGSLALIGLGLIIAQWVDNIWALGVFYGIVVSIGFAGASNVTATTAVVQWFEKHRGLAIGFVTSGMAVGQMVVVPLAIYTVNHLQWKNTFLIFGSAILFVFAPLVFAFIRSRPEDIGAKPYGVGSETHEVTHRHPKDGETQIGAQNHQPEKSLFSLLRLRYFWLLAVPYFFCGFTDLGLVNTHFIPYAEGKNFSSGTIALTISLLAAFNITGTIVSGHISDRVNRSRLLAAIYAIRAFSLLLLLATSTTPHLLAFGMLYGITDMATITPTSSLCAHLFGRHSTGAVFGLVSLSHQIGSAAGSFIPGMLYDWTGSYSIFILFSTAALFAVSGLVLFIRDDRSGSTRKALSN